MLIVEPSIQVDPSATRRFVWQSGAHLARNFGDQVEPYMLFGCNMVDEYKATLFRFPLRGTDTAARSEIKQDASNERSVLG
jgi:sacsin